jgi:hypothetical protein
MRNNNVKYIYILNIFVGQSPARSIDHLSDGLRSTIDIVTPRKKCVCFFV